MTYRENPELQSLLDAVEQKYGKPIISTNDFNTLSAVVRFEGRETLSPSTLKRLWGYVSHETTPRKGTLDVLSRFVGCKDFNDFRLSLLGKCTDSSCFLDTSYLAADDIEDGRVLSIGWEPNRLVKLRKLGGELFEVVENNNSKLKEGDRLMCSCYFKGLPLIVPSVHRGRETLPSYIAGKATGLNVIKLDS